MRAIITSSTLLTCTALIILINCVIIGNNARTAEVNNGLNSSMDYAYDKMIDYYYDEEFVSYYKGTLYLWKDIDGNVIHKSADKNFIYNGKTYTESVNGHDYILKDLMQTFCSTLQSRIGSNGALKVDLLYVDLDAGTFQIKITEYFAYPLNRTGICSFEKTYSLY